MSQNNQKETEVSTPLEADLIRINDIVFDAALLNKGNAIDTLKQLTAADISGFGTGRHEHFYSMNEWLNVISHSLEQTPPDTTFLQKHFRCRLIGTVGIVETEIEMIVSTPGESIHILTRFTIIYEFSGNNWQIVHSHVSFPSSEQTEGEAWPLEALKAKNRELEKMVADRTAELKKSLEQLQNTQQQLVHSEKMASLGELTAGIAHEIQNPLNFVNNFAEVNAEMIDEMTDELRSGNSNEAFNIASDVKDNNLKIAHHGKRADGIVKNMLQHSRATTGEKEPTDINALVDECLRLSYHGLRAKDKSFNVNLHTDLDAFVNKVNIVPQEITRVLVNLFNNALYSVAEKKKQLNGAFEPAVFVSTRQAVGKVQIRVKDNGLGIPKNVVDKIYQPFFTTKPAGEGTGLGLSLSFDIITKGHSGEIKVNTTEGEGAEFVILLPA